MPAEEHRVRVHLDDLLSDRGLTLTELADKVGITLANLSVLKNGRARAIRFTTLTALCDVLHCQPGDILRVDGVSPAQDAADSAEAAVDRAKDAVDSAEDAADSAQDAADREPATASSGT
jgi:putative transcriptional regulator